MTNLKISDSDNSVLTANMTEMEAKDARIKSLEDEVYELKTRIESLLKELDKAERKAYRGLGD